MLKLRLEILISVNEILVGLSEALNLVLELGSVFLCLSKFLSELEDSLVQSVDLILVGFASATGL